MREATQRFYEEQNPEQWEQARVLHAEHMAREKRISDLFLQMCMKFIAMIDRKRQLRIEWRPLLFIEWKADQTLNKD